MVLWIPETWQKGGWGFGAILLQQVQPLLLVFWANFTNEPCPATCRERQHFEGDSLWSELAIAFCCQWQTSHGHFVPSCVLGSEPNNCWAKPDNNHGLLEAEVESGTSPWQPGHIKWEKKASLSSKARKQFPQGLIKDEEIKGLPEQMN